MAWRQLDEKTVARLVAEATAAPSMHNAQPWRFRFLTGERLLLLYADLERAMPRSDPDNRALHIGCGAALLNLRVAAAHADLVPQIRLLPEPQDPLLLAGCPSARRGRARAGRRPGATAPGHPGAAHQPLSLRREGRPRGHAVHLAGRCRAGGSRAALPRTLARRDRARPDPRRGEPRHPGPGRRMRTWSAGPGSDRRRTPPSTASPSTRSGRANGTARRPCGTSPGSRPVADRGTTAFEHTPHLALLSTRGDGPADWLRAGQALERVLLEATLADLVTSLTSHALEDRALRLLARDPGSGTGQVQMVLRLGYGPRGPATLAARWLTSSTWCDRGARTGYAGKPGSPPVGEVDAPHACRVPRAARRSAGVIFFSGGTPQAGPCSAERPARFRGSAGNRGREGAISPKRGLRSRAGALDRRTSSGQPPALSVSLRPDSCLVQGRLGTLEGPIVPFRCRSARSTSGSEGTER